MQAARRAPGREETVFDDLDLCNYFGFLNDWPLNDCPSALMFTKTHVITLVPKSNMRPGETLSEYNERLRKNMESVM